MAVEEFFYNGKAVYIISELDLSRPRRTGGRWRTQCPVHGSRDRDLSIAPWHTQMNEDEARLAGWGHCKSINCGAVVLVKEWNPSFTRYITKRPIETCEPTIKLTAKDIEQAEAWQRQELAALTRLHSLMVDKLTHERAAAYLAQRGLSHMIDFLQSLGVGYIPAQEDWSTTPPDVVKKWCDRLVFPFTTAEGKRGYLGRTLRLWTPGMDENQHKQVLAAHNASMQEEHGKDDLYKYQIRRYEKTYRSGFFNLENASQYKHVYITEGPFDAIPLLYEGLPNVVAVAGMTIDPSALPKNVLEVTLAYDADVQGHKALEKTSDALKAVIENLGRAGIKIACCPAPDDGCGKDWSERYRLHGLEGLTAILQKDEPVPCGTCLDMGIMRPALPDDYEGTMYCEEHHPAHQVRDVPTEETSTDQRNDAYQRFLQIAQCLADAIPGGCTVHIDPPGYTIEDRARELMQAREAVSTQQSHTADRPARPTVKCYFCGPTTWQWNPPDQDYMCVKCYSPHAWTLKNNQLQRGWDVAS